MHSIVDTFLQGDMLCKILNYYCNLSVGQIVDPISETICMVIKTPVQLVITEVGVTLFKDKNTHVYPYALMTKDQLDYIRNILFQARSVTDHKGAVRAGIQMGGGCIIRFIAKSAPIFLVPVDVFKAFCSSVFRSKIHTNNTVRYNFCNIVIQRVCSSIHLSNSVRQAIFANLDEIRDAAEKTAE